MNRRKQAEAAVKLLRRAIKEDCQDSADFLVSVIQDQELFFECSDDNGKQITSMSDFFVSLDAEGLQAEPLMGGGVTANATRGRRPTPDERYRARMKAMGKTPA